MNIGFFGGSFDPPHIGHIKSAESFIKEAKLSKLYIIPTYVSPFKKDKTDVTDSFHRLEMCKLAFSCLKTDKTDIIISDIETSRKGTSYTIDTVNALCSLHQNDSLFMYVGTDMFVSLEKWKNSEEIFRKCTVFTKARYSQDFQTLTEKAEYYAEKYNAKLVISKDNELVCSSTDIRTHLAENNILNLQNLLTDDVLRYIIENKLYNGK